MADVYEYIWGSVSDFLGDDPVGYFQESGWFLEPNDQTFEGDEPYIVTIPGAVTVDISEEQAQQLIADGVIEEGVSRDRGVDPSEFRGEDPPEHLRGRMQTTPRPPTASNEPADKVSYEAGYKSGYDDAMDDLHKEAQGNTRYVTTHVLNPAAEDPDENYEAAKSVAQGRVSDAVGESGDVGNAHVVDADRDGYIMEVEVGVNDEDAFRQRIEENIGAYDRYVSDTPTPELIF